MPVNRSRWCVEILIGQNKAQMERRKEYPGKPADKHQHHIWQHKTPAATMAASAALCVRPTTSGMVTNGGGMHTLVPMHILSMVAVPCALTSNATVIIVASLGLKFGMVHPRLANT
jgi:hypothetical protein